MRNDLCAFNGRMEKAFGIECFSMDTKIVLYVVESTACNIKDAQYASGLSHRGFYLRLRNLMDDGFILLREDSSDGRKKLLSPTEKARSLRQSLLHMRAPEDDMAAEPALLFA